MRWFVYVSSMEPNAPPMGQPLCVEAPQWQPALQKARMLRGDTGALASFSIEVLEDGYSAVDPLSKLRYLIQRAPDDAPLSMAVIPKARASSPGVSPAPAPVPAAPSIRLFVSRDEEPTAETPLTYKERVYAVPKGTPDNEAHGLLMGCFDELRTEQEQDGGHVFLSLAVFDHLFETKPRRRPLVTLEWKSWKGQEPEIHYPAREAKAQREAEKAAGITTGSSTPNMPALRPSSISGSMPAVISTTKTNPPPSAKRLLSKDLERTLEEGAAVLSKVQSAEAGAEGILEALQERFPCELMMVSFYEAKPREFVVVKQSGRGSAALSLRTSEFTPAVRAALIAGEAVVIAQAAQDSRIRMDERWKAMGYSPKSLVCIPLQDEGTHLGLLELVNPLDGDPFSDDESRAFTKLGKIFSAFLAAQGR